MPAERFAAVEFAAGLRACGVDRAKLGNGIQRDTGTVGVLIHATRTVVENDKRVGNVVRRSQLDDEVAATAASGAGRKIGVEVDGAEQGGSPGDWRSSWRYRWPCS